MSLTDFFKDVVDTVVLALEAAPLLKWLFLISFLLLPVRIVFDLVFDGVSFNPFVGFGTWIKNTFTDFMMKLFGFDVVYKMGLARLGVDYVECASQDCSSCPFSDKCGDRRKQYDSVEISHGE